MRVAGEFGALELEALPAAIVVQRGVQPRVREQGRRVCGRAQIARLSWKRSRVSAAFDRAR